MLLPLMLFLLLPLLLLLLLLLLAPAPKLPPAGVMEVKSSKLDPRGNSDAHGSGALMLGGSGGARCRLWSTEPSLSLPSEPPRLPPPLLPPPLLLLAPTLAPLLLRLRLSAVKSRMLRTAALCKVAPGVSGPGPGGANGT
jgi:hypothetical protein